MASVFTTILGLFCFGLFCGGITLITIAYLPESEPETTDPTLGQQPADHLTQSDQALEQGDPVPLTEEFIESTVVPDPAPLTEPTSEFAIILNPESDAEPTPDATSPAVAEPVTDVAPEAETGNPEPAATSNNPPETPTNVLPDQSIAITDRELARASRRFDILHHIYWLRNLWTGNCFITVRARRVPMPSTSITCRDNIRHPITVPNHLASSPCSKPFRLCSGNRSRCILRRRPRRIPPHNSDQPDRSPEQPAELHPWCY